MSGAFSRSAHHTGNTIEVTEEKTERKKKKRTKKIDGMKYDERGNRRKKKTKRLKKIYGKKHD